MDNGVDNPDVLARQLNSAADCIRAGKIEDASAILDGILTVDDRQPDALQLMGLVAKRRGDDGGAVSFFRRALAAQPAQPNVWNNLGNVLARQGAFDEAVKAYSEAIRLSPQYVDALINLGLAEIASKSSKAISTLTAAAQTAPQNAAAWSALGQALSANERLVEAAEAFEKSLSLKPGDLTATHNLAVVLRRLARPNEALLLFERCAAAAPARAEIQYNLGHCYYDLGRPKDAFKAYERAIEIDPGYREAHDTLNRLYWQHEEKERYLASYAAAIAKTPQTGGLWADWAHRLAMAGESGEAIELLNRALARGVEDPDIHHRLGQALAARQRLDEAAASLQTAVARNPDCALFRHDLARTLIALSRDHEALDTLRPVLETDPYDQQALAYAGLAWRMLGDGRAERLLDCDRFVKPAMLPAPAGYASIADFNRRLEEVLAGLHRSVRHPLEQTLRGGSQTMGRLFDERIEEVKIIEGLLRQAVETYIAALPSDPAHPFLSRCSGDFHFSGSWSVRLRRQGFHVNHVHPEGWISSAYYVGLPAAASADKTKDGWIKFGESSLMLGGADQPLKLTRPESGMLVLFPSYLYHGTIPFDGEGFRTTIAFDVAPA